MLFRFVLWGIAVLLAIKSRIHPRCQRGITRDMSVTISAHGGAARTYVFNDRRVNSYAGAKADATIEINSTIDRHEFWIVYANNAAYGCDTGRASATKTIKSACKKRNTAPLHSRLAAAVE